MIDPVCKTCKYGYRLVHTIGSEPTDVSIVCRCPDRQDDGCNHCPYGGPLR